MLLSRDKGGGNYERYKISTVDPNPSNFIVKRFAEHNGNLAVEVNYPNCTNYEGNKIIAYKDCIYWDFEKLKEVDPHFSERGLIRPFARFEPTEEGWKAAILLINIL